MRTEKKQFSGYGLFRGLFEFIFIASAVFNVFATVSAESGGSGGGSD